MLLPNKMCVIRIPSPRPWGEGLGKVRALVDALRPPAATAASSPPVDWWRAWMGRRGPPFPLNTKKGDGEIRNTNVTCPLGFAW